MKLPNSHRNYAQSKYCPPLSISSTNLKPADTASGTLYPLAKYAVIAAIIQLVIFYPLAFSEHIITHEG